MNSRFLKNIIREKGMSIRELARLSGIRKGVLRMRIWGLGELKLLEIVRISEILKIDKEIVEQIFFS